MNSIEQRQTIFTACSSPDLFPFFTTTLGLLYGFLCQGEERSFVVNYVVDQERKRELKCEQERKKQLLELEKRFASDLYCGHQDSYFDAKTRFLLQNEKRLLDEGELKERFGSKYLGFVSARMQDRWFEVMLNTADITQNREEEKKKTIRSTDFDLIYQNVTIGGGGGGRTFFGIFSEHVLSVFGSYAKEISQKKQEGIELSEMERKVLITDTYVNCHGFLQKIISNLKQGFDGQKEVQIVSAADSSISWEKYKERVSQIVPKATLLEKFSPRRGIKSNSPRREGMSIMPDDAMVAKQEEFFLSGKEFTVAFSQLILLLEEREKKDFHEKVRQLAQMDELSRDDEALDVPVEDLRHIIVYKKVFKTVLSIFSGMF